MAYVLCQIESFRFISPFQNIMQESLNTFITQSITQKSNKSYSALTNVPRIPTVFFPIWFCLLDYSHFLYSKVLEMVLRGVRTAHMECQTLLALIACFPSDRCFYDFPTKNALIPTFICRICCLRTYSAKNKLFWLCLVPGEYSYSNWRHHSEPILHALCYILCSKWTWKVRHR